jgi:hypothetical protein
MYTVQESTKYLKRAVVSFVFKMRQPLGNNSVWKASTTTLFTDLSEQHHINPERYYVTGYFSFRDRAYSLHMSCVSFKFRQGNRLFELFYKFTRCLRRIWRQCFLITTNYLLQIILEFQLTITWSHYYSRIGNRVCIVRWRTESVRGKMGFLSVVSRN